MLVEKTRKYGKAALNMLYAEYNYEDDIAVQREEAAEEAWDNVRKEIAAAREETAAAKEEMAREKIHE